MRSDNDAASRGRKMVGGGKKKIAPGDAAPSAATEVVSMHGMAFTTVVDNAGAGRLRQTAWGDSSKRSMNDASATLAALAGVDRKERQLHILVPRYDKKGWKHKNVGVYPDFIPEELDGVLPEDDYEAAARELNAKAEQLQAKLGSTLVTRALLFLGAFGILLPWLLALPRIQYEPPPPNATDALNFVNSTNVTCVNCVPENLISVILDVRLHPKTTIFHRFPAEK